MKRLLGARSDAIGDLREFCTGARQFRNKVDITAELEARASRDIKKFDTIIEALEAYKATFGGRQEWVVVDVSRDHALDELFLDF